MKEKTEKIVTHGREFTGVVVSDKASKSVTVEWVKRKKVPKYERYDVFKTKVKAHNVIGAKTGDTVMIKECRPLSKTKHFIVTKIMTDKIVKITNKTGEASK